MTGEVAEPVVPESPLVTALTAWYGEHRRALPWRGASPWGVLVSEFMLQQTPVDRVLPVWQDWMRRWPTPAAFAATPVADVLRAWGRLGYPRRALRLHQTALAIVDRHGGDVPAEYDTLRALPGVGDYTASAVLAFAFDKRSIVLDTNVRRVIARTAEGEAQPPAHVTRRERETADLLWPKADAASALWSAAVMEFGALVCRARTPLCTECPVVEQCRWYGTGKPDAGSVRRQPEYNGSDRQMRGHILQVLREASTPVAGRRLARIGGEHTQRKRAMASLLADGLVTRGEDGRYFLGAG